MISNSGATNTLVNREVSQATHICTLMWKTQLNSHSIADTLKGLTKFIATWHLMIYNDLMWQEASCQNRMSSFYRKHQQLIRELVEETRNVPTEKQFLKER